MAALLVSLRWRQLMRQLTKSPWIIVATVFTSFAALSMLGMLAMGVVALRFAAPDVVPIVLVCVGTLITLGWWLGSLIVGIDDSLAPERFALLPVSAHTLLPGLTLASAVGIGGIGTSLALLLTLVGWSVSIPALIAALLTMPIAFALCVLGARVIAGGLAKWLANRRTRDLMLMIGVLLLTCSGLLVNLALSAVATVDGSLADKIGGIVDVIAYLPFAAIFGVPAAIAEGAWLVAGIRFVIALATLVLLWFAARALLAARLVEPITITGGGAVHSGTLLDRILPANAVGGIAARSARYRFRDPRHILNVIMLLVLPGMFLGLYLMNRSNGIMTEGSELVVLIPAINALLISTVVQMDLAYDHDAQALHVLVGVRGRDDRAGRLLGISLFSVPISIVLCLAACAIAGRFDLLLASLGATLGPVIIASALGAWIGSFLPGRAPAPEANPLGKGSSGGVQSMIALLIAAPLTAILGGFPFWLAIMSMSDNPLLAWASIGTGLLIGAGVTWFGVVVGGSILDRRWPEVIQAVTSE